MQGWPNQTPTHTDTNRTAPHQEIHIPCVPPAQWLSRFHGTMELRKQYVNPAALPCGQACFSLPCPCPGFLGNLADSANRALGRLSLRCVSRTGDCGVPPCTLATLSVGGLPTNLPTKDATPLNKDSYIHSTLHTSQPVWLCLARWRPGFRELQVERASSGWPARRLPSKTHKHELSSLLTPKPPPHVVLLSLNCLAISFFRDS